MISLIVSGMLKESLKHNLVSLVSKFREYELIQESFSKARCIEDLPGEICEILNTMMREGFSIDTENASKKTILYCAVDRLDYDFTLYLIKQGANLLPSELLYTKKGQLLKQILLAEADKIKLSVWNRSDLI